MFAYIALNLVVLAGLALFVLLQPQKLPWREIGIILAVLLIMTAIFDSLLVANQIVAYDPLKILGLYVGRAPLEDFAYTVAVVILVPYLWRRYARKD